MTGGFRGNRYGATKFEQISAEAKKDGERKPAQIELKDPVQPLFAEREDADEV